MPKDYDDDDDDRPRRRRPADDEDDDDDRPRRRRPRRDDDEDDAMSYVVPYKNGHALAAYYCAVFGLIPLVGIVLGLIAVILGISGLKKVRREPRIHGTGHAITGIVLGAFDVLYCPVGIGILALAGALSK